MNKMIPLCVGVFAALLARSGQATTMNYPGMACTTMTVKDPTTLMNYSVVYNLATQGMVPYITGIQPNALGSGLFQFFYCPAVMVFTATGNVSVTVRVWDDSTVADAACVLQMFDQTGNTTYAQERDTTGASATAPSVLTWLNVPQTSPYASIYCAVPLAQSGSQIRLSNIASYQIQAP